MKKKYTITYKYFNHSLKTPITIGTITITNREGFYAILSNNQTIIGIGEIAPLPGLSTESIKSIKKELDQLPHIHIDSSHLNNPIPKFPIISTTPSIQFGIETALLMSLSTTVTCQCHTFASNLTDLPDLKNQSIVKCKIGRLETNQEVNIINDIITQFPNIKCRFDANNNFSLEEALTFFNQIPKKNIDYIEAPCKTIDEEKQLYLETQLPIAQDSPKKDFNIPSYSKNIIIKPTIMGSIANYLTYLQQGKTLIFSASYESIIGLSGIAYLSSIISPQEYHGLNTNHIFSGSSNKQLSTLTTLTLQESINWINNGYH